MTHCAQRSLATPTSIPVIDVRMQCALSSLHQRPSLNRLGGFSCYPGYPAHLPFGRPVLVLIGGAGAMAESDICRLRPLFDLHLAPLCERYRITVLTGGTDCGVMRLMGQARRRIAARFPLIAVVSKPGVPNWPLQPDHSDAILLPNMDWRAQARAMSILAASAAATAPGLTLLVNGGDVSEDDLRYSLEVGRPVLALAESGRLADRIAATWRAQRPHPLRVVAESANPVSVCRAIRALLRPQPVPRQELVLAPGARAIALDAVQVSPHGG